MTTDYDAPRNPDPTGQDDETVKDLKTRRTQQRAGTTDIGEPHVTASNYSTGLDLMDGYLDELSVPVHAQQEDEFTCTSCFLVQHRHLLARTKGREQFCRDCA
jgi:hypothetical protein